MKNYIVISSILQSRFYGCLHWRLRDSRPKIANQEAKESLNVIIQEIEKNHV
jgi:hypothetical protein